MPRIRKNYHREALAIMEHPETIDLTKFLWWVSRAYPSVLYHGARMCAKPVALEGVCRVRLTSYHAQSKLDPIKWLREIVPGMGLKEAKDIVDAVAQGQNQFVHLREGTSSVDLAKLNDWFTYTAA